MNTTKNLINTDSVSQNQIPLLRSSTLPSSLGKEERGTVTNTKNNFIFIKKALLIYKNSNSLISSNSNSNSNFLGVRAETGRKEDNLYKFLQNLTSYRKNLRIRGIVLNYNKTISYSFNKNKKDNLISSINLLNTEKFIYSFFKSIYCLISKPVFVITADKVIIELFYYLNIPKYKVFKWFTIFFNKNIKNLYLFFTKRKNNKFNLSITKNWKLKKSIFRLKNKTILPTFPGKIKINNAAYCLDKLNLFKFNLAKVYENKFKLLTDILSTKFNKAVELNLIRLHHPYHDSNILVNSLDLNLKNKKKNVRIAIQKIFNRNAVKNLNKVNLINTDNLVPAFMSGINIKIAGRLMREPIIPRITTKTFDNGAKSPGKVNFLDSAIKTRKNKKGAYTIKISSGQNLFM
jgi:hypothetical protein